MHLCQGVKGFIRDNDELKDYMKKKDESAHSYNPITEQDLLETGTWVCCMLRIIFLLPIIHANARYDLCLLQLAVDRDQELGVCVQGDRWQIERNRDEKYSFHQ